MSELQRKNDKTIRDAFSRFMASVSGNVLDGIETMCDEAVKIALSEHKGEDVHPNTHDGYGYAIYKDGRKLRSKTFVSGNKSNGRLEEFFDRYLPELSGWDAVVVADMSLPFLNWNKERDILTTSAFDVRSDFQSFFRYSGKTALEMF